MNRPGSVPVAYKYATPSGFCAERGLALATSGGVIEAGPGLHPYFFTGFLAEPGAATQALLAIAAIAGANYYLTARVMAMLRADAAYFHRELPLGAARGRLGQHETGRGRPRACGSGIRAAQ
jgi:hypothetical protein